ncbi:MAG: NAD(P)H-dependent oxidoreductase, partial [Campylobacter sp.]
MKQICVILAHPYEKSLNTAIANTAVEKLQNNGYEVKFHDLYKEKFNPILSGAELISDKSDDELLKAHQKDIANAYGIVIVHPNWWGEPPAILKGWIDRVFRQGIAYDFAPEDSSGGLPIG